MNTQQIETFKGLVKSYDISDLGFLKKSSSTKFFEDATHFTKAVLKDLIIDSEKYLETKYFDTSILEHMTIYVSSDLKLESQDKIKITHSLWLNKDNNSEDQILSKQSFVLISKNIDKSYKIDLSNSIVFTCSYDL